MNNERLKAFGTLTAMLIIFVNQALVTFGFNPLPFSEEQIYEGVSMVLTAVVGVFAWWKNQNVTEDAVEAQKVLDTKKKTKK